MSCSAGWGNSRTSDFAAAWPPVLFDNDCPVFFPSTRTPTFDVGAPRSFQQNISAAQHIGR